MRKFNLAFCKKRTTTEGRNVLKKDNVLEMHLFFICVNFFFKKERRFVRKK